MNDMKKSNITHRIRNAWQALRDKPYKTLTVGMEIRRCHECDYYKAAHEPTEITLAAPPAKYYHEIEYLENVVLVILYEATEDGPVEIARGHGHIIHEGAKGITQATSYALKKIWYKMPK
jgi:hypothetical protein